MAIGTVVPDRPAIDVDGTRRRIVEFEPLAVTVGNRRGVLHDLVDHDARARARALVRRTRRSAIAVAECRVRFTPVGAHVVIQRRIPERHRSAVGVRESNAVVPFHAIDFCGARVLQNQLVAAVT